MIDKSRNYITSRLLYLGILTAMWILSSCGDTQSGTFNAVNSQLTLELLSSIESGEREQALDKLQRINATNESGVDLFHIIRDYQDDLSMIALEEDVLAKEFETAQLQLYREIQKSGNSARLTQLKKRLEAMIAVRDYVKAHPYPSSTDALSAFNRLPPESDMNHKYYTRWRIRELKRLRQSAAAEKIMLCKSLSSDIDHAYICQADELPTLLSQLGGVSPAHPVYKVFMMDLEDRLNIRHVSQIPDPVAQDLALYLVYHRSPVQLQKRIGSSRYVAYPASLITRKLQIEVLLQNREYYKGFSELQKLIEIAPEVDLGSIKHAINASYSDHNKQNRPINVTNIIGQLYQLEHHQSH